MMIGVGHVRYVKLGMWLIHVEQIENESDEFRYNYDDIFCKVV